MGKRPSPKQPKEVRSFSVNSVNEPTLQKLAVLMPWLRVGFTVMALQVTLKNETAAALKLVPSECWTT